MRASGDLVATVLREWTRGARLGVVAASASATALLWGLALRPWSWPWATSPIRRTAAVVPVTEGELLVLAAAAMMPVLAVLLLASLMVQRRVRAKDFELLPSYTTAYANKWNEELG